MKILRSVSFSALVLVLSACTYSSGVVNTLLYDCPRAAKHTKLTQWDKVKTLDITIQGGNFDPAGIYMTAFEPYVLRITNKDDTTRMLFDQVFFRTVALAGISIGGTKFQESCIRGVSIGPGQTAELRLVPLKEGTYYYQDSGILVHKIYYQDGGLVLPGSPSMLIGTGYGMIIVKRSG